MFMKWYVKHSDTVATQQCYSIKNPEDLPKNLKDFYPHNGKELMWRPSWDSGTWRVTLSNKIPKGYELGSHAVEWSNHHREFRDVR